MPQLRVGGVLDLLFKYKNRAGDAHDGQVERQGNPNPEMNLEDCLAYSYVLRMMKKSHGVLSFSLEVQLERNLHGACAAHLVDRAESAHLRVLCVVGLAKERPGRQ